MSASEAAVRIPAPDSPTQRALTLWQRRVVWACWLLGGLARMIYLFVIHPANQFVFSDMNGYYERAVRFATQAPGNIGDTLYPPGTSMMLGMIYLLDPSWILTIVVQWLLSLAVMGLVWLIARRVYGTSAAVIALVLATLYFPFVHYASLWLAENPFTVFVLASIWLLLLALPMQARRKTVLFAVLAGIAAGVAIAFKNTMLGSIALTGLVCTLYAVRHRDRRFIAITLGVLMGLSVVMAPLAVRCTRLNEGHVCLSANNLAMNVLIGHYGPVREFRFIDQPRQISMYFTAVESSMRNYSGSVTLDFGPYDSVRNMALARQWILDHPVDALGLSLHNVWSLFAAPTLWPTAMYRGIDYGIWSQRAFWLLILLPAVVTLIRRAPAMWRLRAGSLPEWLMLAPLIGVVISVFISIAEVRFRVPFDGLLMVLAAPAWLQLVRLRALFTRHRRAHSTGTITGSAAG